MNHFILDYHEKWCKEPLKVGGILTFPCHSKFIVFLVCGEFYLIEYNGCVSHNYDEKEAIISQIMQKKLKHGYGDWHSRRQLNEAFKKDRDQLLRRRIMYNEVNYIYDAGFGKTYCITNSIPYAEIILYQQILEESYKKSIDYINKNIEKYASGLTEDIKLLYRNNRWNYFDDAVIYSSIDHALKMINIFINNKNLENGLTHSKKSKQQGITETRI